MDSYQLLTFGFGALNSCSGGDQRIPELGFACSMLEKRKNLFSQMVVINGDLP